MPEILGHEIQGHEIQGQALNARCLWSFFSGEFSLNQSQSSCQQAHSPGLASADGKRILVVEDDPDISHLLDINLRDNAFEVDVANNGPQGLELALTEDYQLIVLDLMLPGLDGLEICKRLRSQAITTPILMLTAKISEFDRVLGLELGADDYLGKPFSIMELQARVKAILRRVSISSQAVTGDANEIIESGDLRIDVSTRKVRLALVEVPLGSGLHRGRSGRCPIAIAFSKGTVTQPPAPHTVVHG